MELKKNMKKWRLHHNFNEELESLELLQATGEVSSDEALFLREYLMRLQMT